MASSSLLPSSQLSQEREKYKQETERALKQDPDPLAAYDSFVKWTLRNYSDSELAHSGLLELLEEATRTFVDDWTYKTDWRYLKLWLLYANHVQEPATVYAYILAHDIGIAFAQIYQEYATLLEKNGQ